MRQVSVETVISAPREPIFDLVADLGARPSFADHYLKDYRLARMNPRGLGASARFLLLRGQRAEITIVECDRPRRIVEEGRVGRRGRSRLVAVYDFVPEAAGLTRVELTTFSEPATLVDRIQQRGVHRWIRRKTKRSLERLRQIFEEPGLHDLERVSVAGADPAKGPRFGDHVYRAGGIPAADG